MDRKTQIQHHFAELESNPNQIGSAARLIQLYENTSVLVDELLERAEDLGPGEAGGRFATEACAIALLVSRETGKAGAASDRAASLASNTSVWPELKLLMLAMTDDVEGLFAYFGATVEELPTADAKSRLYYRMGQLLEVLFEDLDEAKNAFVWSHDLDPGNFAALWAREEVAKAQGDWGTYAELLYAEVQEPSDVGRQLDAMMDLGDVYSEHLGQVDGAAQCYATVFENDPSNLRARAALTALGYELPPLDDIDVEVESVDSEGLGQPVDIDAEPLDEPEDEEERAGNVTVFGVGMMPVEESEVVQDVTQVYEEEGEVETLAMLDLDAVPDVEPASPGVSDDIGSDSVADEVPAQADDSLAEESDSSAQGSSGADESSADELPADDREEEALPDAPESNDALVEFGDVPSAESEQTATAAGADWHGRFVAVLEAASRASDEDAAAAKLTAAARLWSRHGGSVDEARRIWREALAVGAELQLYERAGFLFSDASIWREVAAETDNAALAAKILVVELRDPEAAKAKGAAAEELLSDLEDGSDNWRKFQRTLEARWEGDDKDEQARKVYFRMADIAKAIGDADKEMDALRRLDRQVKDDERTKFRLQEIYRTTEKWPMYVDLLKAEAAAAENDPAERVDVLEAMVRVYRDEMNHDMMVVNTYREILDIEPANMVALDALIELYDKLNRSSELIATLQAKADLVDTHQARVAIHSHIAKLFLERFRNQAEAIKSYETVLELDPYNVDAIEFLKDMYEKRREWEKLIDVHKREIETFETAVEKAAGLKLVADIATDKLRKPEVAAALWIEVRKYAPEDSDALDALEKIYEKTKDYESLAEILETKARLIADADARLKLLGKLAPLYSDRLQDLDAAIRTWRAALELAPDDLKARKSLERLYIDNGRWDDLEAFYAQSDSWAELVRLLETLANTVKEDETKIELLVRAARVWRERLGDTSRAERNLERVLQLDDRNEGAALELEPIYEAAQDSERLKVVYEIILSHRDSVEGKQPYQLKLARLHEAELGDVGGAFSWYAAAYADSPWQIELMEDLERTADAADRWVDVVSLYKGALAGDLELELVEETRLRTGRVLSEKLGALDEALTYFQAVLAVDEENQVALSATADIYRRSGRWDDLMAVYQRQIELTEAPAERVKILSGMASIAEHQAGDVRRAIQQYNEALAIDAEYEPGLVELHRLYRQESQWEELAGIIRREIALVEKRAAARQDAAPKVASVHALLGQDDSEAHEGEVSAAETLNGVVLSDDDVESLVGLRFELGVICQRHLGADDEAVASLGQVLAWRPNHAEAREAIEDYLFDASQKLVVARILEPVYELLGDWNNLIASLKVQAAGADDGGVELLTRAAFIYLEELGQPQDSFATFGRVVEIDPANHTARAQLYRIADAIDGWENLVALYEKVVQTVESDDLRQKYWHDIADIYADRLHDANKARAAYEAVLKINPTSTDALDDLEALFTQTEDWNALRTVLERKLELAESADEREVLRTRMGLLWEEMLGDRAQAIDLYVGILNDNPANLSAISALNRLYTAEARWEDLSANLERELELTAESERSDVKNRLAAVLEQRLQQWERAVDLYEEVLDDNPRDEVALAALERLMYEEAAPRSRISEILEPLYVDADDWAKLIAALEVQVETNSDDDRLVSLLHRIAALHESRGADVGEAFVTYARALHHGVDNDRTLQAIYRIGGALQAWDSVVEVFEREAAVQAEPSVKRELLRRAAGVYRTELDDAASATARLHEVIELFPEDLESLVELEDIYRNTQAWGQLVTILTAKAEIVEDVEEKKSLMHQAGTMYEDFLDAPEKAIEVYLRALEFDDTDLHAIDRLEVLYRDLEMWDELLKTYERKVELSEDGDARKDLFYAMGAIYREALGQKHDAIDVFRKVLEIDPAERAAWMQLDELFEETEQWNELLETLEAELMLVTNAEEANNLKFRIGRLWETHLYDPIKAIDTYRDVLTQDPFHSTTTEALEGMISRGESEALAAEVLEPIYRDAGEWEKLINVYRLLNQASDDVERKLELHWEIGEIFEHRLGDPTSAFVTYTSALHVDPVRHDVLNKLEELAGQLDVWETLIERLDERIEDLVDFASIRTLQIRIARIQEEELGDPQAAIARFNRVLEGEPTDEAAIIALDRLYEREGQWNELADILRTRILQTSDPDETLQLRLRLGQLYQTALEDESSALEIYQTILMDDAENPNAIASLEQMFMAGQAVQQVAAILEPFYSSRGQHSKLVEIYVQRLELLEDPSERFDIWMLVARTFLDELKDPESALAAYGKALIEKPEDENVIAEVLRLSGETNNWRAGAQFLLDALDSPQITDEGASALYLAVAGVFDRELGLIDEAEQSYLNVLALDDSEPTALEALDRIYEHQGRWQDLADILRRRVAGTYDEEEIVTLNYRLAELYQAQLGALDDAVSTYQTILDIQPGHMASLKALERIFYQLERWESLYDVMERDAEAQDDPEERADLYSQMATIAEQMLGRTDDAIDLWNRVLQMRDDDVEALQQLRRLYIEGERWTDLVGVIEREVELTLLPEDQLPLFESLGIVWSDKLGNEAQAIDAWRKVLEIDPYHLQGLISMRQLYMNASEFAELAAILYRLIEHPDVDAENMVVYWEQLGEIQGDSLMQTDKAIQAWKQVLAHNPGHERALESLERLFLAEGQWEDASEVLEMKLDRISDAEGRIDLLLQIADIWENKILDRARAARYYELVLEIDPVHERAGASLESIYREIGTTDAYQALATLYLDRADNNAHDPDLFLEARRASARVFEQQLQQLEGAFLVLVTAFRADTIDDENLLGDLERLAGQTNQWADLVAEVEKVLGEIPDSPEAADLHRKVGLWQSEHMGLSDDAIYHLQRALLIEPDNIEVMEILERLYRQIGAWAELAQILRARVDLTTDPDEQIELWRKLGELYEMQMGQIDEAIGAYNAILHIDPADILAIESLERIYEAYDRWQALVDVLNQKAAATYDPDEIVAIRYRMAQVLEERLNDIDQTVATYQQILEVDQTHVDSLGQLERLFVQTQNWPELLGVYEQQLQLTHEPSEQLAIYSKMGSLNENQFDDVNSAIESYNNMLMVAPGHLGAIENLERLYRGQENWFDLAEILQRHSDAAEGDPGTQVRALNELGTIQRDQISDQNAAIDAFNRSIAVIRQQPAVWRALADLYDETANWHSAVQALNEEVQFTQDPQEKVQILNRIGFTHEANLQDDVEAERVYQIALGLVPTSEATIFALRDLYARRGDFQGVIRVLKHAESVARELTAKAEFLSEIGKVYDRELSDSVSATHYYESALECDPNVLDAAEPLIDMYINEKRWERALPLLQRVLARRAERDPEDMRRRSVQLARVSMELGQEDQALASFRQAYEMDPADPETLKGLSELLYRRGEWDQAFKIYQALTFNHATTLEPNELRDIYLRSGEIKQRVGERSKAIQFYQKALEFDGYFVPALTSLAENYEAESKWRELIEVLRTLTQAEGESTVRFANLVKIGDIWLGKLNDASAAVDAYLEALDIEPDSVTILRKLLDIYTKSRQWNEAVEMLNRLIAMETNAGRKAKYLYTVGVIMRDEIGDRTEAINVFDQALDADVRMLKAFEAIDRILTEEKTWKDLERAYRRMLRRVAENDDGSMEGIKTLLWQNLGEIYRSRLGHLNSAIQAFEAAVGLKPDDEKLRLILADLYERSDDKPDGAISQHKELIKLDPFRIDSYRALWKSYMQKKEYDKAWCMSGALVFLQNANEQEQKFYAQYLGQNLRLAKGQINQELIKMVYHPEQDMLISFIMSILGQGLRPAYASDIKEWGLHKKKDLLSADEQLMFTKIYSYSARTQAIMPAPALYLRRDQALGMRNANVDPPAFVIGGDMMQGKSDRELAFTISRQLCLVRPEHYLASTPFPTEVLKLFFMAAMHITDPSLGIGPSLGEQGEVWIREIQRIPGPMLMQLTKFMKQYLAKQENPNLSEWLASVDHTATRVGLLLCGDIQQAASCIKNDLNPIGKTSIKDKIREMVLFSISDEYFELRRQLGLSIENR